MNTLHWKRAPTGDPEWHLTFDGDEALCGKKFTRVMRNFSRDLASGPPDRVHKGCQEEAVEQLGL